MSDLFKGPHEWDDPNDPQAYCVNCGGAKQLIEDRDALLAVVRDEMSRAYDEWLDLAGKEKAESFKDWLENVHPLLAALPEHLK